MALVLVIVKFRTSVVRSGRCSPLTLVLVFVDLRIVIDQLNGALVVPLWFKVA